MIQISVRRSTTVSREKRSSWRSSKKKETNNELRTFSPLYMCKSALACSVHTWHSIKKKRKSAYFARGVLLLVGKFESFFFCCLLFQRARTKKPGIDDILVVLRGNHHPPKSSDVIEANHQSTRDRHWPCQQRSRLMILFPEELEDLRDRQTCARMMTRGFHFSFFASLPPTTSKCILWRGFVLEAYWLTLPRENCIRPSV